jgi:hypothetical protein
VRAAAAAAVVIFRAFGSLYYGGGK